MIVKCCVVKKLMWLMLCNFGEMVVNVIIFVVCGLVVSWCVWLLFVVVDVCVCIIVCWRLGRWLLLFLCVWVSVVVRWICIVVWIGFWIWLFVWWVLVEDVGWFGFSRYCLVLRLLLLYWCWLVRIGFIVLVGVWVFWWRR